MSCMSRARLALISGALAWLVAASASAHGRFPATGQIAFHPTDPDVIWVRTTFGLLVTNDGGGRWEWVCRQVLPAGENEDPAIQVMSDGSVVATVFDGVARGTEGGCSWEFPSADLEGRILIDRAPHPDDPASTFVVTSEGNEPTEVWATDDDGASWSQSGTAFGPDSFISERIVVAPSDPSRLYVSGSIPPGATPDPADGGVPDGGSADAGTSTDRRAMIFRSTDGGESWDGFDFALREKERTVHVLGVDPNDPDHLFMRVVHHAEDFPMASDRLVESTDGGESWSDVRELAFIEGFAWSDDGSTVWVGGNEDTGLWRSDDGGESFEQVSNVQIACLTLRDDGELWACAENFSDGFAIGRSADAGASFEPVLVFDQIEGLMACPEGSPTTSTCAPHEPDLIDDLGLDADAGMGGADAGTGGGGGGGGCAIAHDARHAPAAAAIVALALVWLRRRRGVG